MLPIKNIQYKSHMVEKQQPLWKVLYSAHYVEKRFVCVFSLKQPNEYRG